MNRQALDVQPGLLAWILEKFAEWADTEDSPWAQERFRQIVRWRQPESGGHFPLLEVPEFFLDDLQYGLAAVLAAGGDRS